MANWEVNLPSDSAKVGDPTHVEDHNALVSAITEVRSNIDSIELTPGNDGHSPEITFNGTKIVVDGVEGPDLKGAKGDDGTDGTDGAPSQADWDALVARVEALETPGA